MLATWQITSRWRRLQKLLEKQGGASEAFSSDNLLISIKSREVKHDSAFRLATIARQLPCIGSGMVVGVPVPSDDASFGARVQQAIDQAVKEVGEKGIIGASVTPYVLERVRTLTGGESLELNIRLVLNNARVGADIAAAISAQTTSRSKL
jgi:pseudouridine-5'-phosphate glycosidase